LNFGEAEERHALKALAEIRSHNIASDIYPDRAKIGKQMNYANARQIPYVVMIGEEEIRNENFTLKNMKTGEQVKTTLREIIAILRD